MKADILYKVKKVGRKNLYHVIETQTEQVIENFVHKKDAETYAKFLQSGGAFKGFTPRFIALG